mgnify:CR=1 FL=1
MTERDDERQAGIQRAPVAAEPLDDARLRLRDDLDGAEHDQDRDQDERSRDDQALHVPSSS